MEPVNALAVRQMPRAHLQQPITNTRLQGLLQVQVGQPVFGNAVGMVIGQTFNNIVNHGPSRVILEDLIGFGGLRTAFDLSRNWMYGTEETHGTNTSLARERVFREVGNLFATNFLAGIAMYQFAKWAGNEHIGKQFASTETLEYFQKLVHQIDNQGVIGTGATQSFRQAFADTLFRDVLPSSLTAKTQTVTSELITELFTDLDDTQRKRAFDAFSISTKQTLGFDHQLTRKLAHYSKDPNKAIDKVVKELDYYIGHKKWAAKNPDLHQKYTTLRNSIKSSSQLIDDAAETLAKMIDPKADSFGVKLEIQGAKVLEKDLHKFSLNTLLDDAFQYVKSVEARQVVSGEPINSAKALLNNTKKFKKWGMPIAFGASVVLTVVVPLLNKLLTMKVDKISSYPGEIGLREMEGVNDQAGWFERYMPYITNNLKKGNIGPLLASLIPLPFAIGMVDNAKLMNGKIDIKMPWAKGFGKRFARMFQFRKVFPYVPIQQLTALCALVSSARIWTARDKIEARERYVDSYGGWALWIGVLPNIKNWVKTKLDKAGKTAFKGRELNEIIRFTADKDLVKNTLKHNTRLENYIFLPLMLFTMGVAEPLIALKWTESQVKRTYGSLKDKKWLSIGQRLGKRAVHPEAINTIPHIPMVSSHKELMPKPNSTISIQHHGKARA